MIYNSGRLKASLERLQRMTEGYSELLLDLLPPVAQALGNALGVEPYVIQTFTEAEIRANVVFQVRVIRQMYAYPAPCTQTPCPW